MQPAIYLGMAMIAVVWGSIGFHLSVERERAEDGAIQENSNLARVFEEHIVRTLTGVDRSLLLLRSAYLANPAGFDIEKWLASPGLESALVPRVGIVGRDGILLSSSAGPTTPHVDVGDRSYFRAQQESGTDGLFIGAANVGRVTGNWVIHVSRPMRAADGSFLGVVLGTLDPDYFTKFYESIDLGRNGAIMLVGLDGLVRATAGIKKDIIGRSMLGSQLFARISEADAGSFLSAGNNDGIKRFGSYRVVKGYPLVVYVGQAEREVLANYWRNRIWYFTAAAGFTVVIVIVTIFAIRYRTKLDAGRIALRASEAQARRKSRELEVTLDYMNQGIMMVDADRNMIVMNRRLIQLLELPEHLIGRQLKLDEFLSHLWESGEFGHEGEALEPRVRDMIRSGGMSPEIDTFERTRPNGVTLEIRAMALPDGGVVRTFTDVSERKRKEAEIAFMARHDPLTGLANRTLLGERIDQAVARTRRRMKASHCFASISTASRLVNDTRGHPQATRCCRSSPIGLSGCVRETRYRSRGLGGDEFAIVQAATEREEDVEALAKKILTAVNALYDLGGFRTVIATSIGIAMAPRDGADVEQLMKAADIALYRAKSEGGGEHRFFERAHANGMPVKPLASVA